MQHVHARRASSRISVRDVAGNTALEYAAEMGGPELFRLLDPNGANGGAVPAARREASPTRSESVDLAAVVHFSTIPQHAKPPESIARLDANLEASFLFRSLDGGMRRALPFHPKSRQVSESSCRTIRSTPIYVGFLRRGRRERSSASWRPPPPGAKVAEYGPGATFGKLALM